MLSDTADWDFFVSYAQADVAWAEWIAWQLEAGGYRVLLQAWDMVAGANWVHRVHEGLARATRVVAVLSLDRFHLIGHSFGGGLATLVAGLHPEKVSRLVLIDSIGPMSATPEQTRTTAAWYLHAFLNGKGNPTYRTRGPSKSAPN